VSGAAVASRLPAFGVTHLTPDEHRLRDEVRCFLADELPPGSYQPGLGLAAQHSVVFTKKLAARGWLGMAIPQKYGGQGRTAVERFIVVEELLRVGAPVSAHWIADRQTAPTLLAFGSERQRGRFLPMIASGDCFFSIGMSEPDAGSDLSSVKTAARRIEGGWQVSGTKVWTSHAHENDYFVVLCRTESDETDRHAGLSQMIVDLRSPGVQIHPIRLLDGNPYFNEVAMTDVFVPDELVLGEVGSGWRQVTTELTYERAGPDRYLSSIGLLNGLVNRAEAQGADTAVLDAIGALSARLWGIRQMSLAVARAVDAGERPAVQSALVKDLGTTFEQQVVETVESLFGVEPSVESADPLVALMAQAVLNAPAFTIRGGTSEILRMVTARSLGIGR
jgi:alkylation response protein AidB-like acyl-CoA dehydrogenase